MRLKARGGGKEGFLYINAMYGKGGNHCSFTPEGNEAVQLACPECSASLIRQNKACPQCGAGIYTFEVPPLGMVEGCAAKGCDWQQWEEVDASGRKEFIELRVRDTGCGIPSGDLSKIFEPFYTTKDQKGTGLGLAVIWGIIDNHNGTIRVESEPGAGTVFVIHLPVNL